MSLALQRCLLTIVFCAVVGLLPARGFAQNAAPASEPASATYRSQTADGAKDLAQRAIELDAYLKEHARGAEVKVTVLGRGIVLSGVVRDAVQLRRVEDLAKLITDQVVNDLRVADPQQFVVNLELLEISHTGMRAADVKFFEGAEKDERSVLPKSKLTNAPIDGVDDQFPLDESLRVHVVEKDDTLLKYLASLKQQKLAKVLAAPTLVMVSGRPAQFMVGGAFPILVPKIQGTVSTEFKQYGTQVDAVALELEDGRVCIEMKPRFSVIDPRRSVTIAGTEVPGLLVREFEFAGLLKPNQTIVVGGTIRDEEAEKTVKSTAGKPAKKVRSTNVLELVIVARVEKVDAQAPATSKRPMPATAPPAPK
jgi:pilus assembly protein CpaC